MNDSTTPAGTPAAGRPFPGLTRRILAGPIRCDVCGSDLPPDDEWCPACAQRRRRRAGLEAAIDPYGAERPWVTLHRADDNDGTSGPALDEGDEAEGWPW